jgi:hypothetical protein
MADAIRRHGSIKALVAVVFSCPAMAPHGHSVGSISSKWLTIAFLHSEIAPAFPRFDRGFFLK